MPDFRYSAMDVQGRMVKGYLTAQDKQDLIRQLQELGLFLVSASETSAQPDTLEAEPEAIEPPPEENAAPSEPDSETLTWARIPWRQRLLMALMLTTGLSVGAWQTFFKGPRTIKPKSALNITLSKIKENMPRKEIETILPNRYREKSTSSRTLYLVPPNTIVEIEYDQTGGPWSGKNRKQGHGIALYDLTNFNPPPAKTH